MINVLVINFSKRVSFFLEISKNKIIEIPKIGIIVTMLGCGIFLKKIKMKKKL